MIYKGIWLFGLSRSEKTFYQYNFQQNLCTEKKF